MPASLPVLYSFRRCPYAIRARMALLQAGIPVELREVDLKNKPAELLDCSPAATVPVLDLGAGQVLTQSLEIMRWALAQHDPQGWLSTADDPSHRALLLANDGPFKQSVDRYKYAERHPQHPREPYRDEALACLVSVLETQLEQATFLGGSTPGLVDVAVFPFVRQFAAVDPLWWASAGYPATRRWLTHWQSGALWASCMAKVAVWQPGSVPVRFPG